MALDPTKTEWQCPACYKGGCVDHPADESVHGVIALVVFDHEKTSPLCTITFDKLRLRMYE